MTRKSNTKSNSKSTNKLHAALLAIAFVTSFTTGFSAPARAAGGVTQELGACGALADAQFIGNGKKGRSQLTSFGPGQEAGFILNGVQGLRVSQLKEVTVDFTPPQTAGTGELVMLVKIAGTPKRIQRFSLGTNNRPKLPNIPTTRVGTGLQVEFLPQDLVGENSRLQQDDVIDKIAFVFDAEKLGPKITMYVDGVRYDGLAVPLVLDGLTCNLK